MTKAEARAIRNISLLAGAVMVSGLYLMSDASPLNHDSPVDSSALIETLQQLQDLSDASGSGLFVPDLSVE